MPPPDDRPTRLYTPREPPRAVARPPRVARRKPPPRINLAVLLVAAAVLLVVIVLLARELLKAGQQPSPGDVVSAPGELTEEPTELGDSTEEQPTSGPPEESGEPDESRQPRSNAQCEVKNPRWQVQDDTLSITGQVVNAGSGSAKNVRVWVTVRDPYGELLARERGSVVPQRIRPDHSGDFAVEMPLPAMTDRPRIEAQVEWD